MTIDTNTVYRHPSTKQCNYSVSVINNLRSTSTTAALSAYQGKLLNDKISSSSSSSSGLTLLQSSASTRMTISSSTIGNSYGLYIITVTGTGSSGNDSRNPATVSLYNSDSSSIYLLDCGTRSSIFVAALLSMQYSYGSTIYVTSLTGGTSGRISYGTIYGNLTCGTTRMTVSSIRLYGIK